MALHKKEDNKIHEALELLEEAACEKGDEMRSMISHGYENIRDLFSEKTENGRVAIQKVRQEILKKS